MEIKIDREQNNRHVAVIHCSSKEETWISQSGHTEISNELWKWKVDYFSYLKTRKIIRRGKREKETSGHKQTRLPQWIHTLPEDSLQTRLIKNMSERWSAGKFWHKHILSFSRSLPTSFSLLLALVFIFTNICLSASLNNVFDKNIISCSWSEMRICKEKYSILQGYKSSIICLEDLPSNAL